MAAAPKVLIVKLSSFGDCLHVVPAVHEIKQAWPDATIHWLTQTEYASLIACVDPVDRVLTFNRRRALRSIGQWWPAVRAETYEYVLDFQGLLKSAILTRLTKANRRVGPSYQREGARFAYHAVAGPRDLHRHAVDQALDTVRYLGITPGAPQFPLSFPAQPRTEARPRVAYVATSRWPTKNVSPRWMAGVIGRVHQQVGGTAFLLGGAGEQALGEQMRAESGYAHVVNMCGKTNLVELGSLMREIDVLVTVDSGPMHLAAALGVPTVALFGPTDPTRTGPYGAAHHVIQNTDLSCVPCLSRTCRRPQRDHACLRQLSIDPVVDAVCARCGTD